MEKEILRHPKFTIPVLAFIFVLLYIGVVGGISIANTYVNLGVGPIISNFVFLYIYLMFLLRTQLLYYEYSIIDKHLVI